MSSWRYNMSKFSVAAKRFGGFMKRNAFYFLIILCIASVATVIALAVTHDSTGTPDSGLNSGDDGNQTVISPEPDDNKPTPDQPDNPTPPIKKLTFISPCNGTISLSYDDTKFVWYNSSLNQFETHCALDYTSTDLNVYASADGVIKETGYSELEGNYVVIEHEEGYTTKYMSLEEASTLEVGTAVQQGQLIGKMSATNGKESLSGAHLHFEMYKNGEVINPLDVLVLEEK